MRQRLSMKKRVLAFGGCVTAIAAVLALSVKDARAEVRTFNVPEGEASQVIPEFARQAGIQIFAPSAKLRGVHLQGVSGSFDVRDALRMLLTNAPVEISSDDGVTVTLRESQASQKSPMTKIAADGGRSLQAMAAATPAATPANAAIEEVVVTGSRIVREGYEAPTPLTVVGAEQLEKRADATIIGFLATMPAISGQAQSNNTTGLNGRGTVGVQSIDLRALGATRVLVLLDGQRVGPASYFSYVDISSFPAQLMSRVDIVTGGASAVYGSDAVSGVVNFILDRKFTGVKGEVSAGVTNYGDDKNYKVQLSGGFGFGPDDRGHVLLSGEHLFNAGIHSSGGREWLNIAALQLNNPAYTATNGQPQQLFLTHASWATATAGGIVVAGPLKGTAFGAGGVPYKFNYGSIVSGDIMWGGDAISNNAQLQSDLDPSNTEDNLFTRTSYDVNDNLNVFVQYGWGQNRVNMYHYAPDFLPGTATAYVIRNDNPYLPASTKAAMAAAGVTSFGIGSWNVDLPGMAYGATRISNRISGGLEGNFDAFGKGWKWNAYYAYTSSKIAQHENAPVKARYAAAIDAVVNPATGQIVCRSALPGGANPDCKPWNAMGIGVNAGNELGISYIKGHGELNFELGLIEQETIAASVTGEPFSLWAGPVSLAVSAEHRKDKVDGVNDPISAAAGHNIGNLPALHGATSVTEGALETLVPLAKGETWAKDWDLSLAVRFTGYDLAGYVTTWKVGTTYTPVDDIKFRATRSRDIRAPSIQDLFATSTQNGIGNGTIDRFLNTSVSTTSVAVTSGNMNLAPEKADTTGIGVVLTPRFLEGFSASVDYWDVNISGAIQPLSNQFIIDSCYDKSIPSLCANIIRGADGTISRLNNYAINLAAQDVRGIDLEATYRLRMSQMVSDWRGDFSLHGNMTFYLRYYTNTGLTPSTDTVGQNSGGPGSGSVPDWKLTVAATYQLDPISVTLTGRAFSNGTISAIAVECSSGCPASTTAHPTTNANFAPGRFYLDTNIDYALDMGEATKVNLFASVRNMFNASVPPLPSQPYFLNGAQSSMYDSLGAVYRVGVRFKM